MNIVDIIIVLFIFIGLHYGYNKGLLEQLSSYIAWIIYFFITLKYSFFILNYFKIYRKNNIIIVSFIISFIIINMIFYIFIKFIKFLLKNFTIYKIDNILGAIFGIIKSYIYLSIFIILLYKYNYYIRIIPNKLLNNSIFFRDIYFTNYNFYKTLILDLF